MPRYLEWLERWPTVEALAAATPADVIQAWSGLGYNRRAVNLHRCAQAVVERGGFPREPEELRKLPGIGPVHRRGDRVLRVRRPDRRARHQRPSRARAGLPRRRRADPRQAAPTSGTRRCSTSAARCASPERRAAAPARSRAGCPSRGQTYAPLRRQSRFEGSFRQRRARLLREIAAAGGLPESRAAMPRRSSRSSATAWPRSQTARPGCPVRRALRPARPARRARAARRRARSPPAAPGRPG